MGSRKVKSELNVLTNRAPAPLRPGRAFRGPDAHSTSFWACLAHPRPTGRRIFRIRPHPRASARRGLSLPPRRYLRVKKRFSGGDTADGNGGAAEFFINVVTFMRVRYSNYLNRYYYIITY